MDVLASLPEEVSSKVVHLESVDLYIVEIDPRTLKENPKNWRVHTRRQRSTYTSFKAKHGWLGLPIYNLATDRLIDGHMRVDEAIKAKEPFIPVILKNCSEEEENEILATLDNIGLLAKRNNDALRSLTEANSKALGKAKTVNDQKLKQLTEDLHQQSLKPETVLLPQSEKKVRLKTPDPPDEQETVPVSSDLDGGSGSSPEKYVPQDQAEIIQEYINDDVLFPGITDLDIPELLSTSLATPEMAPTRTYAKDFYSTDAYFCISSGPFEEDQPIGTLGFYTEDSVFEDAFRNAGIFAELLKSLDPQCILTPDYSTYKDWPLVMRLWNVYRSRWCGRFWQELGFPIIPSLQSLGDTEMDQEYVLESLPESPVVSFQCRMSDIQGIISFASQVLETLKPELIILYGGQEKQKYLHGYLPTQLGKHKVEYRYLSQYVEQRRKLKKRA